MPAECRVDAEQRVVFMVAWDVFSTKDVLAARRHLQEDPTFTPDMDQLIDMRRVTEFAPSDELRTWASSYPFDTGARRAFVTPADLAFGTMRMYQALSGSPESSTRVFRDMDEACMWLGIAYPG